MEERLRRSRRNRTPLADVYPLLYLSTFFVVGLVLFRNYYTGTDHFFFLIWNLFLAWIPAWLSLWIYRTYSRSGAGMLIYVLGAAWLAFFPNAPYILTDVIHINRIHAPLTRWYDIISILTAAWTGYLLGFVSLLTLRRLVEREYGLRAGLVFTTGSLILCSLGIFIGRFLRWNSWDLVTRPHHVLSDLETLFAEPRPLLFILLFGTFLMSTYAVLFRFTRTAA
jgi:uncharacterized membrane protein